MRQLTNRDAFGGIISDNVYTYDRLDRIETDTENGVLKTFTYDAASQLTGDGTRTYDYDATGNRLDQVIGPQNLIASADGWVYTYDDEKNVTVKEKAATGERWDYAYDWDNLLVLAEYRVGGGEAAV